MARETNVTGRWIGNYVQHGRARPIVADLVQSRERLTGSMRDGVTDTDCSVTEVAYLKSYRGTHYGGYRMGDKLVGFQTAAHVVHYRGLVSSDGETIEGKWWIDADPEPGARRAEGSFTLRRQ